MLRPGPNRDDEKHKTGPCSTRQPGILWHVPQAGLPASMLIVRLNPRIKYCAMHKQYMMGSAVFRAWTYRHHNGGTDTTMPPAASLAFRPHLRRAGTLWLGYWNAGQVQTRHI